MPIVREGLVEHLDQVLRLVSVKMRCPNLKSKVRSQDFIKNVEVARRLIHQMHESENNFLIPVQVRSIVVLCHSLPV